MNVSVHLLWPILVAEDRQQAERQPLCLADYEAVSVGGESHVVPSHVAHVLFALAKAFPASPARLS